jgi:hypothetical protein
MRQHRLSHDDVAENCVRDLIASGMPAYRVLAMLKASFKTEFRTETERPGGEELKRGVFDAAAGNLRYRDEEERRGRVGCR